MHQTPLDAMFESYWSGMLIVIPAALVELCLSILALVCYVYLFSNGKIGGSTTSSGNFIMDTIQNMPLLAKLFFCFYNAFIVAGLVEEVAKYLTIRRMQHRAEVNHPINLVIYGAASGLGFATVENVLYVVMPMLTLAFKGGSNLVLEESAVTQGVITSVFRTVVAIPVHMIFAIMTATRVAKTKYLQDNARSYSHLAPSILLHGLYDVILFLASTLIPEQEGQVNALQIVAFLCSIIIALASAIFAFIQYRMLMKKYNRTEDYEGVPQLEEGEDEEEDDGIPVVTVDIEDEEEEEDASKKKHVKISNEKKE